MTIIIITPHPADTSTASDPLSPSTAPTVMVKGEFLTTKAIAHELRALADSLDPQT